MSHIYRFGENIKDGDASMKNLLGGKGANLCEMSRIGIPVPHGFTMSTETYIEYTKNKNKLPEKLKDEIFKHMEDLEKRTNKKFGDTKNPLLLSVRSGARVSMPGMMDTVLNLGLNDEIVEGLAKITKDPRFAYDSYRRFIQMYGNVVMGIESSIFDHELDKTKEKMGVIDDFDIDVNSLKELCDKYKEIFELNNLIFPQNTKKQLLSTVEAVFESWLSNRANEYRRINGIPSYWGTAVNIQSMVFGNMNDNSATGVAFTRNPSTGENYIFGEYLINAQGEDVVAGIRTPQQITNIGKKEVNSKLDSMEESMNDAYNQLFETSKKLEKHFKNMQDIEFTIENKKLWLLQTRSGKRSAAGAIKIAVDMESEKIISKKEALMTIDANSMPSLILPTIDPTAKYRVLAIGLPASNGAVSGRIVFASENVGKLYNNQDVILVRDETSPEDIEGMVKAKGILTARGGMTSHAAVIARGMGKTCIVGCQDIKINFEKETMTTSSGDILKQGDVITIDGSSGNVIYGKVPTIKPKKNKYFDTIMKWSDDVRRLKIRANAETAKDINTALEYEAEGLGLVRTEHMFFSDDRILHVREMILAESKREREKALKEVLIMQKEDFKMIFDKMSPKPINVRLFDMPLHEFLPKKEVEVEELSKSTGYDLEYIHEKISQLREENPMLGHRGCRLGISYPEIYGMQIRAILESLMDVKATGKSINLELMVPLTISKKEISIVKHQIEEIKLEVEEKYEDKMPKFKIGTMIELPIAALKADELAEEAEYFSFGTNDLTQTTLGLSRDDSGTFINTYQELGIVDNDPFVFLDKTSVGKLIEIAVEKGRQTNKTMKFSVCGEHGGEPSSIDFCEKVGLDYVSCSPFRLPTARIAAAQAVIAKENSK